MLKTLFVFGVIYLYIFYWAKFLVKNPIEIDLRTICDYRINNKNFENIDKVLLHSNSKKIAKYLSEMNKEAQDEILLDYARSKNLQWKCNRHITLR